MVNGLEHGMECCRVLDSSTLKSSLMIARGLAWILDDYTRSREFLQWRLGLSSLGEHKDVPIHVPHGWVWRSLVSLDLGEVITV